ncbi:hypothetical protein I6A94_40800, partial [Frankia sp. CN4]|nr:hypothetical protein [Frankia nepalensis]
MAAWAPAGPVAASVLAGGGAGRRPRGPGRPARRHHRDRLDGGRLDPAAAARGRTGAAPRGQRGAQGGGRQQRHGERAGGQHPRPRPEVAGAADQHEHDDEGQQRRGHRGERAAGPQRQHDGDERRHPQHRARWGQQTRRRLGRYGGAEQLGPAVPRRAEQVADPAEGQRGPVGEAAGHAHERHHLEVREAAGRQPAEQRGRDDGAGQRHQRERPVEQRADDVHRRQVREDEERDLRQRRGRPARAG